MDKKTGIILGIITAIVVILIAVVFVADSKTPQLSADTLLTVGEVEYSINDFKMYSKLVNHDDGDINKKMTEEETLAMMDEFLLQKMYYNAAISHGISIESGDAEDIRSDYEKDAEIFAEANISKEDYIKLKEEQSIAESLEYDLSNYYTLPDEMYNSVKESYEADDLYKTYTFRMMQIPYEKPESGDESGDVASGDVVEVPESGDTEDLSREAQSIVANDVLSKIKSGDDFEELAKEYGSNRFTFKGKEYTLINGEIEYATSPLLQSKLGNEDLYNAVLELASGDVTEVIEDEEYTSFYIVKLEALEDGFVGEGEAELKEILLSEYADNIVSQDFEYEMNQGAFMRMMYK